MLVWGEEFKESFFFNEEFYHTPVVTIAGYEKDFAFAFLLVKLFHDSKDYVGINIPLFATDSIGIVFAKDESIAKLF